MKRLLVMIMVSILAVGTVAGCAGKVETYTESGTKININVNHEFIIALKSNPTTGFSWQESHDGAILELVESNYEQDKASSGMVGVGGTEYYTFKALKKGETEITMVYRQPWAGGAEGETKVFTVNIK